MVIPPALIRSVSSPVHLHAEAFEKLLDRLDVQKIRNVVKGVPSIDQKRRGQDRQRGVLGAADPDLPREPLPPDDHHLVHRSILSFSLPGRPQPRSIPP